MSGAVQRETVYFPLETSRLVLRRGGPKNPGLPDGTPGEYHCRRLTLDATQAALRFERLCFFGCLHQSQRAAPQFASPPDPPFRENQEGEREDFAGQALSARPRLVRFSPRMRFPVLAESLSQRVHSIAFDY